MRPDRSRFVIRPEGDTPLAGEAVIILQMARNPDTKGPKLRRKLSLPTARDLAILMKMVLALSARGYQVAVRVSPDIRSFAFPIPYKAAISAAGGAPFIGSAAAETLTIQIPILALSVCRTPRNHRTNHHHHQAKTSGAHLEAPTAQFRMTATNQKKKLPEKRLPKTPPSIWAAAGWPGGKARSS